MKRILTLVSSRPENPLSGDIINDCGTITGQPFNHIQWLAPEKSAAVEITGDIDTSAVRTFLDDHEIDFFITPPEQRRKKLLLADMDSTIIQEETLDELASFAGLKDKISAITALAMEGKLDFESALRQRVALLKGLKSKKLQQTLSQMKFSPGAKILVNTMKKHGATCILVSGGFMFFTEAIAKICGFDGHHGNALEIENNVLTGRVTGPIVGKNAKAGFLDQYKNNLALSYKDCMAIGDGANDIPMLKKAGLGIGYHPRNAVKKEITNLIIHGDLTAALYAQGYSKSDFAKDWA